MSVPNPFQYDMSDPFNPYYMGLAQQFMDRMNRVDSHGDPLQPLTPQELEIMGQLGLSVKDMMTPSGQAAYYQMQQRLEAASARAQAEQQAKMNSVPVVGSAAYNTAVQSLYGGNPMGSGQVYTGTVIPAAGSATPASGTSTQQGVSPAGVGQEMAPGTLTDAQKQTLRNSFGPFTPGQMKTGIGTDTPGDPSAVQAPQYQGSPFVNPLQQQANANVKAAKAAGATTNPNKQNPGYADIYRDNGASGAGATAPAAVPDMKYPNPATADMTINPAAPNAGAGVDPYKFYSDYTLKQLQGDNLGLDNTYLAQTLGNIFGQYKDDPTKLQSVAQSIINTFMNNKTSFHNDTIGDYKGAFEARLAGAMSRGNAGYGLNRDAVIRMNNPGGLY